MKRPLFASVLVASSLACFACAALAPLVPRAHAASGPQPTLFGHGPELYVSPTWGTVGQRVTVVGLGYQPGRSVALSLLPYDPWAGLPLSTCLAAIRARTTVRPDGTLRAAFVIPQQEATLLRGGATFTLDARTTYGRGCAAGERPTGSHALFVLMSKAFAPGPSWGR